MPVMKTYIAGAPYHEGARDAIAKLRTADELVLVREPSNPHDRNAVAVHAADGTKLGYVPRVDAGAVAKVLDRELTCSCRFAGCPSTTSVTIEWEA